MVAYILSFSLVTYTIGLMQSATVKVDVYPIWAVCFLTVFGCTNSITAYSLEDNHHVSRQLFQCTLYTVYVLLIMFSVADVVSFIAVFLMLVITMVKVYLRAVASMNVTTGWLSSKLLADYMDSDSDQDYNPVSMKGYYYLVSYRYVGHGKGPGGGPNFSLKAPNYAGELTPDDFDVITIDNIWHECDKDDGPLSLSVHACEDVCLSYSLFKLSLMSFFGYNCGESTHHKTHDFVFKGLLQVIDNNVDSRRVIEVIETEMALLYDYFFTKYGTLRSRSLTTWGVASVTSLLFLMALTIMRAAGVIPTGRGNASRVLVAKATYADNTITVIILASLALLEVLQMVLYWISNWGRVAFVCQFIRQQPSSRRKPSCSMRLKAFLSKVNFFNTRKYYWKHQIGQYSLLQSIGHDNHL